jgi:hypothetical protein
VADIRILVTGGRDYTDRKTVTRVLTHLADIYLIAAPKDIVLVHGDCKRYKDDGSFDPDRSADQLAEQEARKLGWHTEPHPAKWKQYGAGAGPIRNQAMVRLGAHYAVVFPGGEGTKQCRRLAANAHIPVIPVIDVSEARHG